MNSIEQNIAIGFYFAYEFAFHTSHHIWTEYCIVQTCSSGF